MNLHDGVSKEKWERDNPENLSLRTAESQKTKSHEKKELSIKNVFIFFFFHLVLVIKPPIHEENPVGKSVQAQEKGDTDDIFFVYCPRFYFLSTPSSIPLLHYTSSFKN